MLEKLRVANNFWPDGIVARHEDLVRDYATSFANAVTAVSKTLHDRAPNHHLLPQFYDAWSFTARCGQPYMDNNIEHFAIYIPLGMFPRVIGLANRLAVADQYGGTGDSILEDVFKVSGRDGGYKEWDAEKEPMGMLTIGGPGQFDMPTRELALDAMMLAFFHETAHALSGHQSAVACALSLLDEKRAIESDADYGAGSYFCMFLPKFAELLGTAMPRSSDDCLRRLSRGAFLLTSLFQSLLRGSERECEYHLPVTRLHIMLGGAAESLHLLSNSDRDRAARLSNESIRRMVMGLSEVGLDHYIVWEDPRAEADLADHNTRTYPIVLRLHDRLRAYRHEIT